MKGELSFQAVHVQQAWQVWHRNVGSIQEESGDAGGAKDE